MAIEYEHERDGAFIVVKLLRTDSSVEASLEFVRQYDALWPMEQSLNHLYALTVLKSLDSLSRDDRSYSRAS